MDRGISREKPEKKKSPGLIMDKFSFIIRQTLFFKHLAGIVQPHKEKIH